MHVQEQDTPPNPATRRSFQFSLRTLVIVVLVYATLWAITAVWGGFSAERRLIGFDNPGERMDRSTFEKRIAGSRDHQCYYFEATAFAPFLLRIEYRCSLKGQRFGAGQGSQGDGWVFWFFGYYRWFAGNRMIT